MFPVLLIKPATTGINAHVPEVNKANAAPALIAVPFALIITTAIPNVPDARFKTAKVGMCVAKLHPGSKIRLVEANAAPFTPDLEAIFTNVPKPLLISC